MKLAGKRVLITGASSGIGEASAKELAAKKAIPILIARRYDELKRVQQEIETQYGSQAELISADISTPGGRKQVYEYLKKKDEPLHILIHNAGIAVHGSFAQSQSEVLRQAMEINFFAAVELTALLLPLLKRTRGKKAIVLVSTPSGLYGIPKRFAYSASKAAGHAWLESLRFELREDSIFTSIYCPGYTRTNLRRNALSADGKALSIEQAKGAHSPAKVAQKLCRVIQKEKRIATMDLNGFVVYWLRTLAPALLEWMIAKKLK